MQHEVRRRETEEGDILDSIKLVRDNTRYLVFICLFLFRSFSSCFLFLYYIKESRRTVGASRRATDCKDKTHRGTHPCRFE